MEKFTISGKRMAVKKWEAFTKEKKEKPVIHGK